MGEHAALSRGAAAISAKLTWDFADVLQGFMRPAMSEVIAPGPAANAGRCPKFTLGRETYGIPVLQVREIIRMTAITPVPRMPAHVKGVINLRGEVTPVMDLRLRLDLTEAAITDRTCIIVAQLPPAGRVPLLLGLMVDPVEEVVPIAAVALEAPPEFGGHVQTDFTLAMARVKGDVKTLLDLEKLVAAGVGGALQPAA
jgi:purine-binding chemotaxis protein CheW